MQLPAILFSFAIGLAALAGVIIVKHERTHHHEQCVTEVYRQSRTAVVHERTCMWTTGKSA